MNLPTDLSPEIATWMRTQMLMASASAAAPLREEIDRLDDWMNGLFIVLINVLPHLLRSQPELAQQLEPQWRSAADRFERLAPTNGHNEDGETAELLEARKMLYRTLTLLQVWPHQKAQQKPRGQARRAPRRA